MIITDSENPVSVAASNNQGQELKFTVDTNPLNKEAVLDCNGAGDSFVGGFLAHICTHKAEGCPDVFELGTDIIKDAVRAGNLIAREVIQRYGCAFPTVDQIKDL
jgi:sugar/nucleoside kinase (ribokinase family)